MVKHLTFMVLLFFVVVNGGGKTISIVKELERIKRDYPECLICTNIHYTRQDYPLVSWRQLLTIRNGSKGVVFVIDEIQNQYNQNKWKDFPEEILSVVTQQRKQKIKIFLSSQVYQNVVIQLRRQCYEVVECKTFFSRWTRLKCYDADDYNTILDNPSPEKKFKLRKKYKYSYIQDNYIRSLYDTNKVVEDMEKAEFISRAER